MVTSCDKNYYQHILWNNSSIRIDNRVFCFVFWKKKKKKKKTWYNESVKYIGKILSGNGFISSLSQFKEVLHPNQKIASISKLSTPFLKNVWNSRLSRNSKISLKFRYAKRFLSYWSKQYLTVLIHNLETAWPTKISMPFFSSLDNLL